jgi:hypothetical protein
MENLQRYLYWEKIQEKVANFARRLVICNTKNTSNQKLVFYMPFPVPSKPWEIITMDFVGGFPMTHRGHGYFSIVLDQFIKMCVLIPCKKTISRREAIDLFFSHVRVHFGFQTSIISNRDRRFLGIFWKTLWERVDTKLNYFTFFHPQIDE